MTEEMTNEMLNEAINNLINTPECIRPETVEENKAAGTTYDIYEE